MATIQLAGRDMIVITGAFLLTTANNAPIACRLEPESAASQPADGRVSVFKIVPNQLKADPRLRLEITQSPIRTTLRITGKSMPLPTVQLIAETTSPLIPVCLQPRDPDRIINAAIGPVSGAGFDGLFDAQQDWAASLIGQIHYEDVGNRVRLTIVAGGESLLGVEALTITTEPAFLKRVHNLTGYAPLDPRRIDPMPAAWMPIDQATPLDEIARNTTWMAVNLRPYGAASVLVPGTDHQRPNAATVKRPPSTPSTNTIEHMRRTTANIVSQFWGQGFVAQPASSVAIVGEPLPLAQARGFASLLGLSGRSPIAAERMHLLPDQRVELLRRIIPAAPIRAVDLYVHHVCPPIWNLAVSTNAGRWNVLGLFNASDETRTESVELEDLHLGSGAERFAVYDFWENRLVRIATDRFSLQVPAGGCRVVRVTRIDERQPTILGTSRHITCGATDLHAVRWNDAALRLSGRSDLAAHDPYELWLYLPEGDDALEIKNVTSTAPRTQVRSAQDVRVITFESDVSGPVTWEASFQRSSRPAQAALASPRNLQARQNTRGVLLSWYQSDEHAVRYHIYRNQRQIAETETCEYQDSTALYNTAYEYAATAVNANGQESLPSDSIHHQTPLPASANLTQLVPLVVSQEHLTLGQDRSAAGTPMRIAGQRIYRGLGTTAPSRIAYFLGGGYQVFTGVVGIDNRAAGQVAASFRIVADGQTLFTSPVLKARDEPLPFTVRTVGKLKLELIVTEAGDSTVATYANWGNPYLQATSPEKLHPATTAPATQTTRP